VGQLSALDPERVQELFTGIYGKGMELLGFTMALLFTAATVVGACQVGFQLTPHLLAFNWERLSPAQGWSRMLSMTSGVRGLVAVAKIVLVLAVAYWVLKSRAAEIGAVQQSTLMSTVGQAWKMAMHLALAVAGTLGVIGAADYVWQRWRLEQTLRMSRLEVKEEVKREEGDPQVKARVRKLQRDAATKRMLQDVPKATVVLTNPTHLAVALRYERGVMPAPKVVAKGAGFVAARIVMLARRHGVPVLERKPVAQALFKAVKVGQDIPVTLYHVVAEVLAYVLRFRSV